MIKDFILDILFPRFCLGCNIEGTYLCDDCKAILDISEHRYCLCDNSRPNNKGAKCKICNSKQLSGLYFALSYKEKPLTRKLIRYFKDEPYYVKDLAESLALLIADHLSLLGEQSFFKDSILIPIPLDRKEMKKRGYNQSEEIAKAIEKISDTPVFNDVLIKITTFRVQSKIENIKGVFVCQNADKIRDKKIFLVDDVYTTGSTMEECCRVLKEAGAKEVWGMAIARD